MKAIDDPHPVRPPSRAVLLKTVLPQVVRQLECGAVDQVDRGVLADLIALHWVRLEGSQWCVTEAGEQMLELTRPMHRSH